MDHSGTKNKKIYKDTHTHTEQSEQNKKTKTKFYTWICYEKPQMLLRPPALGSRVMSHAGSWQTCRTWKSLLEWESGSESWKEEKCER